MGAGALLMLQSLHAGGPATCSSVRNRRICFALRRVAFCVSAEAPRTWTGADRFTSILAVTGNGPVKERDFRRTRQAPGL